MLANGLGKDSFFSDKSILLLDKDDKQSNDRTWCFWEKGKGDFDTIVHKQWDHVYVAGEQLGQKLPITPYIYKVVQGIDYYREYTNSIKKYPNITFLQETVLKIQDGPNAVEVTTTGKQYTASKVFSSMFDYKMLRGQSKYPVLQQHFIGWFIKTKAPIFPTDQATFMDFSVPQKGNTRFMYVLPFSATEALVEYTLFSGETLPEQEYEEAIVSYLNENLKSSDYTITKKERGNIPMTCFDFRTHNSANILHIGIAGGWAKSSTGYTFMNTSKKTKKLVNHLKKGRTLRSFARKTRFWYYDLLLLDVLHFDNSKGRLIFETLFKNRSPQEIFKFLNEETNLWEEFQIINSCPKREFIRALLRRLF